MTKLAVWEIKQVFAEHEDIDVTKHVEAGDLDVLIFTCVETAKDALQTGPPAGFSDFERDQLISVIDAMRHSHTAIKRLLAVE